MNSRSHCKEKSYISSGFTLIEMLVVIGIISVVLTLVFSLHLFGNKVFALGERKSNVQYETRRAADFITREIRYASEVEILTTVPTGTITETNVGYIYIDSGTQDIMYKDSNGTKTIADFSTINLTFTTAGTYRTLYFNIQGEYEDQALDIDSKVLPLNMSKTNTILNTSGTAVKYTKLPKGNSMFSNTTPASTPASTPAPSATASPTPAATASPTPAPTGTPIPEQLIVLITKNLGANPVVAVATAKKDDVLYAYVNYIGSKTILTKQYRWIKIKNGNTSQISTNSQYTVAANDKGEQIYLDITILYTDGTTQTARSSNVTISQN